MLVSIRSLALGLLPLALVVGCNTPGHVRAVKTADRLEELRASIEELQHDTTETATALADVLARKEQDPELAFQELESAVRLLQNSRRRAEGRLASMRQEAEQYFVTWKEQASTIVDKDLKERSEDRCAKLTSAVERVDGALKPAFESVDSHLASFEDTMKYLSIDLTPSSIGGVESRSKDANKSAKSIHSKLGTALEILAEVAPLFTPPRTSAPRVNEDDGTTTMN